LLRALLGYAIERLKQPLHRFGWDRFARIGRQFEFAVLRGRAHLDRSFSRAVGHRIAKQVGEQLRDAPAVTVDRPRQIEGCLDFSSG
jgi:hypothetical protein